MSGDLKAFTDEELADLWFALDRAAQLYASPFRDYAHDLLDELTARLSEGLPAYLARRRQSYLDAPDQRSAPID